MTDSAEGKDFTTSHEDSFVPSCHLDRASHNCFTRAFKCQTEYVQWDLGQKEAKVRDLYALLIPVHPN